MNNAASMCVPERGEHLIRHRPHDWPRQTHRVHPLVNASTWKHVHDEERTAVR